MTALGWRFLAADPYLLSALGVAWFAGVTTYVTVTLQQSLYIPLPAGRVFAATLTVLGLVVFAAGVGSALTVRGFDEG